MRWKKCMATKESYIGHFVESSCALMIIGFVVLNPIYSSLSIPYIELIFLTRCILMLSLLLYEFR